MDDQLSTVHDAVAEAAFESAVNREKPSKIVPTSVRLGMAGIVAADICASNGTTLAAFLRHCCEHLAKDYGHKEIS